MQIIKNVLLEEELFSLYNKIIDEHSWYLSRGSNNEHSDKDTFPGLIVYSNGDIVNDLYSNNDNIMRLKIGCINFVGFILYLLKAVNLIID